MTPHTDRIRQMAQEAGIQSPEQYDGHSQDCPWMATTDELTRFAQLVAEDFMRAHTEAVMMSPHVSKEDLIRARYSLKD